MPYDGPQLVFTGELDASLSGPPGHAIETLYPNAGNVVFRNATHVRAELADYPPETADDCRLCALELAHAFFADPGQALDTRCAQTRRLHLVE